MVATFLMSYPGPAWRIRGGANFRSRARAPTSPRAALAEWLRLADAVARLGGRIWVMPPAGVEPPLTGMIYTANAGALIGGVFVVSKMAVAHRQAERQHIVEFLTRVGLPSALAAHTWEGQADVCALAADRFLLTWGVRSIEPSVAEVRARLPAGADALAVRLRDPYFHGDTCLNPLQNLKGRIVLLAHAGALVDHTLADLQRFSGAEVEVLPVSREDALGYAANALGIGGRVLLPSGLSTELKRQLAERDFELEEIELAELFGKGGDGPRCLVNRLDGLTAGMSAPELATERDRLGQLLKSYPESVA